MHQYVAMMGLHMAMSAKQSVLVRRLCLLVHVCRRKWIQFRCRIMKQNLVLALPSGNLYAVLMVRHIAMNVKLVVLVLTNLRLVNASRQSQSLRSLAKSAHLCGSPCVPTALRMKISARLIVQVSWMQHQVNVQRHANATESMIQCVVQTALPTTTSVWQIAQV